MEEKITNENQEKILKKTSKMPFTDYAMLVTHGCNNAVSVFVTTFLISYIYEISENFLLNIGLFYASNYLFFSLAYFFISHFVDKSNRVIYYRVAIVLRALFILSLVFVGEKLAGLLILAGLIHGVADAFYWSSYNIMKNELISSRYMKKYATAQISIEKLVNSVLPIALGIFIDSTSFQASAVFVLVIAVFQMVMSFFIKSKRPENSSFDFRGFIKDLKGLDEKKKVITLCLLCAVCYGVLTVESSLNTILIMMTLGSNFSLGLLTGIFSAVSVLVLIFIRKFIKTGKRTGVYILCSILPLISAALVIFAVKSWAITIHICVYTIANVIYAYLFDLYRNLIIKKLGFYDDIAEYNFLVEFVMGIARTITFGIMCVVGLVCVSSASLALVGLKIFFFVSILFFPLINLLLYFFEKKLIKFEMLK